MKKHESELQYVVRQTAAGFASSWGDKELADKLDKCDPQTIGDLRESIQAAQKAWSNEFQVVSLPGDGVYWNVRPELIQTKEDGPVVRLTWGWNPEESNPSVTMMGEDAFELALKILSLFEDGQSDVIMEHLVPHEVSADECGDRKILKLTAQETAEIFEKALETLCPKRPQYDEGQRSPEFSRLMDDFSALAKELISKEGFDGGVSWAETSAWMAAGKPEVPFRHEWVEYPEDHVVVCSVCGHYYFTDCDDWGGRVCSGKPVKGKIMQSIHDFDPRRTPELREAQRLDCLISAMVKTGATAEELNPFLAQQQTAVESLSEEDRQRYERERVGLGPE